MGVTLMGLSSLYAAYGPGDFCYILVVIETTQTCLDVGGRDTQASFVPFLIYQCTHGNSIYVLSLGKASKDRNHSCIEHFILSRYTCSSQTF